MALDIIGAHEEIIGDDPFGDFAMSGADLALGDYLAAGGAWATLGDDEDDDIAGAEDDDLASLLAVTGAAMNPKALRALRMRMAQRKMLVAARRKAAARANAMRAVQDRSAVAVDERRYNRKREYPLGLDSGAVLIAAGAAFTVTVFPQVTFRGERLVVDSSIAAFFNITNVVVGKNSQLVTPDPVPASAFSEVSVGVRLLLDTSNIGNVISVSGVNVDVAPHRFRGAIIGTALDR